MRLPASLASFAVLLVACGHTPIRVDGVMGTSQEMRPLQHVPPDAYRQLRVLVRLAGGDDSQGARECGYAQLEGTMESEDLRNAACVPSDAPNDVASLVRQRLRAYGVQVARDASEPYDYAVEVRVTGAAPKKADPLAAKAIARLTFRLKEPAAPGGFYASIDPTAAASAFSSVARDCGLKDAELTAFSSASAQPMNPEFDVAALAAEVVDNAVGCEELARFFHDAQTRYPKPAAAPPPAAPPAPAPPAPPVPSPK
ncbi:MAG TPA: hypothetical protein VGG39_11335 [Polyangiaceae bacterium]|jgi:hypothetical protein